MASRRTFALVLFMAAFAYGCLASASAIGTRLPSRPRFVEEWRHYEHLKPAKAIAVAGDFSTIYVSGYAFGYANEEAAVGAAMEACEARRIDRRVTAPCRTYAVGDQLVEAGTTPISRR